MKNWTLFDVAVDDIGGTTVQLESLGERRTDPHTGNEVGNDFRAVADAEGNEFCLVTKHTEDRG